MVGKWYLICDCAFDRGGYGEMREEERDWRMLTGDLLKTFDLLQ